MRVRTLEERFFAKVEKTDACWLWTAATRARARTAAKRREVAA